MPTLSRKDAVKIEDSRLRVALPKLTDLVFHGAF